MSLQLEVCAFTIQSCLIAQECGAHRVELCDNPLEGGTTPGYGTIRRVRERLSIPVYPILRPRSMNYYYDAEEWAILYADIDLCKQLGCDGISIGVQKINGEIDADAMHRIRDRAYPMGITCNRAFDAVPDPFAALEILIACGVERVLASTAPAGVVVLQQLVRQSAGRISIMPGAGVRSDNLAQLIEATGATEFHASARVAIPNPMTHHNPLVTDAGGMYVADREELLRMIRVLDTYSASAEDLAE
jgi:copper homeostasis protein